MESITNERFEYMTRNTSFLATLGFLGLHLFVGCSGRNSPSRYEPPTLIARNAIETALKTWESGSPFGPIAGKPAISVFDQRWQSGKKLESFEMLDKVTGTEHPQFKVRLKIKGNDEEVNEFLAVGIDPLFVFRDKDYRKASGQ